MDTAALATAMTAARQGQVQMAVASKIAKMNADQGAAIAGLLDAASQNMKSMLQAGVGTQVDVSA